ncbi:MAG: GTPase [candidate division Zixibacteria bacterium]|nr:GTPase [candidate division Zixibacteria bacterium]
MPANLPPQYYELEREFKNERDPREKLRLAQELLRMMPKHKGTDKLQAEVKAKISQLKKTIEGGGNKSHGARQVTAMDHIDKEGAGQIILVGPPNSGKSSLLDVFTHAKPLVADYPFSTREPQTGMMTYDTVQLQLIDTPPISADLYENYMSGLIRNADMVTVVADLSSQTMIEDLNFVLKKLEEKRIILKPEIAEKNEQQEDARFAYKKTIICAHKEFEDEACDQLNKLKKIFENFVIIPTSILDEKSLENLQKAIFTALSIIRVYTKPVGHEPDYNDPIILSVGGTVEKAAETLHRDIAEKLKFAKIWGEGKFDGQKVQGDFELNDKDIVEFHI